MGNMTRFSSIIYLALIFLAISAASRADLQAGITAGDAGYYPAPDMVQAQLNLGMNPDAQVVKKHSNEGLESFRRLALGGNVIAQYMLGRMYYKGHGVPRDFKEAMVWFRMAAEQGLPEAQRMVGKMYHNGEGVPQDYNEARQWFLKAAEQERRQKKII